MLTDSILGILSHDPDKCSGNQFIDEDFLREWMDCKDFSKYQCVPGIIIGEGCGTGVVLGDGGFGRCSLLFVAVFFSSLFFNHQAMNPRQWRSLCLNWVGLMLDEQRCEVESEVVVAASLWPGLNLVLFCSRPHLMVQKKVVNKCE